MIKRINKTKTMAVDDPQFVINISSFFIFQNIVWLDKEFVRINTLFIALK